MAISIEQTRLDWISDLTATKAPTYIALSDDIWEYAELRFQEHKAVAAQSALLEAEGLKVTKGLAGMSTAFVAEAGSGSPVIGFLGEYDALAGLSQAAGAAEPKAVAPGGAGQGCGHNMLGVGSMLAAVLVKRYLEEKGLPGTVRYYGCPGEEGGSGKTFMARNGVFDDLDAAFCWHASTFNGVMAVRSLANIQVYFRFRGRAAHAAGAPHLGRSALDAVELTNVGVNYLREHMPSDCRVHYAVTNTGGISPNVVQANAAVLYLVRAPNVVQARALYDRVCKVAQGAALMTETELQIEIDKACSDTLPNSVLEWSLYENLKRLGPVPFDAEDLAFGAEIQKSLTEEHIRSNMATYEVTEVPKQPLHDGLLPYDGNAVTRMGSTDVGDVSWVTPTAQVFGACWAIGTPGHSWQVVAQGKSSAAHKGMLHAAKALAASALDVIHDPALLERAKAEFHVKTEGKPYLCPIPEDVLPASQRS
ncbi:MAG TPA: M20 family metallopeptidase [Chloroflexota bacterium]|nr:M20 family metallopeptidase [Chloroflexota bacterium]